MIRVGTLKEMLDVADDVNWNAGKRARRNDDPRDALEKPPIVGGDRTRDERQECKGFEKASPAQTSVERVDLEKHVIQWLHVRVGPLGKAHGAGKVAHEARSPLPVSGPTAAPGRASISFSRTDPGPAGECDHGWDECQGCNSYPPGCVILKSFASSSEYAYSLTRSPARPHLRARGRTFPENAFMTARHRFGFLGFLLALVISAAPLFAQATQTPPKPQTQKPATAQKPYEPQVGQEGKDVVWVPTPQALVDKMLDMAKITPQDFLMDLGSGDGRTVITAAKRGTRAMGIEYNPDMVELSKRNAAAAGVSDKATFAKADLFETDLSKATVITMFLLPSINMKLRPTILNLKPGTRVVSNTFTMEDWQADETSTISDDCTSWCTALLWIVPAKVEGAWSMPQGELKLTQQFQNVTGTLGSTAVTGKLRGNDLTFTAGNVKYSGKVEGNMIHGASSGTNGKPWMATRK